MLVASLLAATAAPAAAADSRVLLLRGRVTHEDGTPVERARIVVSGAGGGGALTDRAGAYQVAVPLGNPGGPHARELRFTVRALKPGWRLELPGASPALEARVAWAAGGPSEASANDPRIAQVLRRSADPTGPAAAVATLNFIGRPRMALYGVVRDARRGGVPGVRVEILDGDHSLAAVETDEQGRYQAVLEPRSTLREIAVTARHPQWSVTPGARRVALRAVDRMGPVEFVAVRPAPPRRPPGPVATAASPSAAPPAGRSAPPAAPSAPAAAERRSPRVASPPRRAAVAPQHSGPALPPGPDPLRDSTCGCRVHGIAELVSGEVVWPPPRVEVTLAPAAGVSDTIRFFMGAPRAFDLRDVPCGRYVLRARNLDGGGWGVVNTPGMPEVHCESGSDTELRILLERR